MRSLSLSFVPSIFTLSLLSACDFQLNEQFELDDAEFAAQDNTPQDNPQTPAGVALGRALFYDTLLSLNESVSCASCHQQENGFSDPVAFSEGFDGGLTGRNSMSLINVRFYEPGAMFWDERAASLEEQVLMPIFDEVEMGLNEQTLLTRISQSDYYAPLYLDAFGDEEVTLQRTAGALAQFVRSIISHQSKWDLALEQAGNMNGDLALLSDQENLGRRLFFDGGRRSCAGCHLQGNLTDDDRNRGDDNDFESDGTFSVLFMDQARHNGLSIENGDQGLFEATGNPNDIGKFKSPSLRNVELTGPYMHDGRFGTLEEVVEHYNSGVEDHPNLDNRLERNNNPRRLNLSNNEKAALVAFLKTFTDETLATNPRFSDPFVQ